MRKLILFALALYLLALGIRLPGILGADIQGDEIMWNQRSNLVLSNIERGNWASITSHLGHPGIPATAAMTAAKFVSRRILPSSLRVDDFGAARVGNAFLSAFVAPVIFLGLLLFFGSSQRSVTFALLSACFAVFDPNHIAISRLAHIDSSLAVMVLATVLLFAHGTVRNCTATTVLAGMFWGLSIASKPTALALLPAFLLFKIIRFFIFDPKSDLGERKIVAARDVWAVIAGLVTLTTLFSRFWMHHGPFLTVLNAESLWAEQIYSFAMLLRSNWLAVLGIVLALALVTWAITTRPALRVKSHIAYVPIGVFLICAYLAFPAVFENLIRYILRLRGLAEFVRVPTQFEWGRIPGGYFGVILFQTPLYALSVAAVGVCFFLVDVRRARLGRESLYFALLCAIVFFAWFCELAVSPKEFVRYLVPVTPFLGFVSAYGVLRIAETALAARDKSGWLSLRSLAVGSNFACLATIIFFTQPHYLNFFNALFGGLSSATQRQIALFYDGHGEALSYVQKQAQAAGKELRVAVVSDLDPVQITYRRKFGVAGKLNLETPPLVQSADFVLVNFSLQKLFETAFNVQLQGLQEVYRVSVGDVPMVGVFKPEPLQPGQRMSLRVAGFSRRTGGTTAEDRELGYGERVLLYALPERHKAGDLFFGADVVLEAGEYTFGVRAGLPLSYELDDQLQRSTALRVHFGDCEFSAENKELHSPDLSLLRSECHIDKPGRAELRGEWTGETPIVVDTFEIERIK